MEASSKTRMRAKALRRRLSLPEVLLWRQLKGRQQDGLHFRKQHPFGVYVLDFYCHEARLAVEVDGAAHDFGGRPAQDERRDRWLRAQGIRTLRLDASFVLSSVDDAVRAILAEARWLNDPLPAGGGGAASDSEP